MILLALLVACGWGDGAPVEAPVPVAEDSGLNPLDDEAYRFCHEPDVWSGDAAAFCELLRDAPPERCPGLRETCVKGNFSGPSAFGGLPGGCNGTGGAPTAGPAAPPEPPSPSPSDCARGCELPKIEPPAGLGLLGAVLQWVTAILVALVVLVVLRLILKYVGRKRDPKPEPAPVVVAEVAVPAADEIPDAPVADLLGAASRAFDEGRWADVVLLARGAALRRLGDLGRVTLHRSRTDREYLRSVRKDQAVHEPLRDVLGAVESHRWGGRAVDRDRAASVLAAARRLIGLAAAVLALAVITGAAGDWRYGPVGDAALLQVFEDAGFEASWRLRGLTTLGDDVDVLVLDLSGVDPGEDGWAAIRTWVAGGGVLLAGGTVEVGFPELGSQVAIEAAHGVRWVPDVAGWLPAPRWPDGPATGWQRAEGTPWIEAAGASAVNEQRALSVITEVGHVSVVQELRIGEGLVLALSDPMLLYNGALVSDRNVTFLGYCLWYAEGRGSVSLPRPTRLQLATLSAPAAESPVSSLRNAKLLPFVIQLLVLVAIGAVWKGWPFAVPRDPPEEGRLRFVEHVTALGEQYARLKASGHAREAVVNLWMQRLGPHGLEQAAIQAGRSPEAARAWVQRLSDVDPDAGFDAADLELMEELWTITSRT